MENIKLTMGVGEIYNQGKNSAVYKVLSLEGGKVIIQHFDKYPLVTNKQSDYLLYKLVVQLMCLKEHLTMEGLGKIVGIKASLASESEKGLSELLKEEFPAIVPIERPIVKDNPQARIKNSE